MQEIYETSTKKLNMKKNKQKHGSRYTSKDRKTFFNEKGEQVTTKCTLKKEKAKGQYLQKGYSKSKSTAVASNSKTSDGEENLEIPGFYFDKEKKKYFRILPGHNNCDKSSVLTKERLQKKHTEEQRQINLKKIVKSQSTSSVSSGLKANQINKPLFLKNNLQSVRNVSSLVDISKLGLLSDYELKNKISKTVIKHLKPFGNCKVFKSSSNSYERLEHMQNMYATNTDENNLVCLWSLKDLLVQRIQTVSIKSINKSKSGETEIQLDVVGAMIPKAFSKVTSMCSAPSPGEGEQYEHVLYTTMCVIGNNPSMAMLRNLNCSGANDFRLTEFNLSSKATWCCAWNSQTSQFSVGTEKMGLLLDVESRKLWELSTDNSDVFSQIFAQDAHLLYSGTRKGSICGHDLRSRSTYPVMRLHHSSAVNYLKFADDSNYLLAADFNSKIKLWDMRQKKVVLQYKGHNNSHSMIPFHVNNEMGILYAAGQDCYVRIWDIKDGCLLHTLPPPHPADINTIPTLYCSRNVGKYSNRPGLLMGMLDEFHFYSL